MKLVKTVAVLSVAFAASSVFALPKGFQANPTGATTKSIQAEGVKHIGVTLENEGEHKGKASIFVSVPRLSQELQRKVLPITSLFLLPKLMRRQTNSLSEPWLEVFWVKTKTVLQLPICIG